MADQDGKVTGVGGGYLLFGTANPKHGDLVLHPAASGDTTPLLPNLSADSYYLASTGSVHDIVRRAGGVEQPILFLNTPKLPTSPTVDTSPAMYGTKDVVRPAREGLDRTAKDARTVRDDVLNGRDAVDGVTKTATTFINGVGAAAASVPAQVPQAAGAAIDGIARAFSNVLPRQDATFMHGFDKQVVVDDGHGTRVVIPAGSQAIASTSGLVRLTGPRGEKIEVRAPGVNVAAGTAELSFTRRPDGTLVMGVRGNDLDVGLSDRSIKSRGLSGVEIAYNPKTGFTDVTTRGTDVRYSDKSTGLQASGAFLHTRFDSSGHLASIDGGSQRFQLAGANGDKLDLSNGRVDFSRDGDAVVMRASAANGSFLNREGLFDLGRNGSLEMRMTRDLVTLTGTAGAFTYADGHGRLAITNGRIDGSFGSGAQRESLRFTGDSVRYSGTGGPGQVTDMTVSRASAEVTRDATGATRLTMSGRDFGLTIDGHRLGIANAQQVAVQTLPNGNIASIDAFLPGRSSFVSNNRDIRIGVEDLSARYTGGATEHLRLAFSRGEVDIKSLGLYGTATNVAAGFRLDADGHLAGGRVDVGTLSGKQGDLSLRVNNREGDQVRLLTRFAPNGQFREALLRVPQQGEVLIDGTDAKVRLGHQVTRLMQGADGSLRVQSRDFEAAGTWRDVDIDGKGAFADASLVGGQLVINKMTGASFGIRNRDWNVRVNVAELDNLLVQAATFNGTVPGPKGGLVSGATLTLTRTANDARITAKVSATYQGKSFSVDIADARQLEALALVRTNQAQVLVRDPSGQGRFRLEAGPLSIEGKGQAGAVVTYYPYSSAVFTESVFNMTGDHQLGDHIRMNTKGTVSLGFYNPANTFWGGVSIMPPRVVDPHADPVAGVHQPLVQTDTIGVVGTLGAQWRTRDGKREALAAYAGAVPGATLNATFQGDARLWNTIPLSPSSNFPMTAIAGLRYEYGNKDGAWAALVGAQANIAGFVDSPYVYEPAKVGGHVGLSYVNRNAEYSAAGTYTPGGGAGFRVGGIIKF